MWAHIFQAWEPKVLAPSVCSVIIGNSIGRMDVLIFFACFVAQNRTIFDFEQKVDNILEKEYDDKQLWDKRASLENLKLFECP